MPAVLLVVVGLVPHAITVLALSVFVAECLRTKNYTRRSGMPLIGPLLITAGMSMMPFAIPVWIMAVPWVLEVGLALVAYVVQRITRSVARGAS